MRIIYNKAYFCQAQQLLNNWNNSFKKLRLFVLTAQGHITNVHFNLQKRSKCVNRKRRKNSKSINK